VTSRQSDRKQALLRIGVIGLGTIAPYFLRALAAPDAPFTLTAGCDLDPARLGQLPPRAQRFTDHRELLASGTVDAVAITLPNDLHAPVAGDALRAGVHVCCEKPLTVRSSDAWALTGLAAERGVTLTTAFHRRHNLHLARLKAELAALPDGPAMIESVTARYHERIEEHSGGEGWVLDADRCGGGCLIDNGPNALDALRHLLGDLTLLDAVIGDVRAGVEFRADLTLSGGPAGVPVRVELDWALPEAEGREVKDVSVRLKDGTVLRADFLAGFAGFKSSLDHEYAGILAAFRAAIENGERGERITDHAGPAAVTLVEEAYAVARAREERSRLAPGVVRRAPAGATLIDLLFHRRADRGMTLSPWTSRCVRAGEIHELVTTTDRPELPGDRVDAVGFLGFAEFHAGTVLRRGDEVRVAPASTSTSASAQLLGTVAGFDECHHPNHYNVLIATDRLHSAETLDLRVGDDVLFTAPPPDRP
jgi:predicted dehydrogenase